MEAACKPSQQIQLVFPLILFMLTNLVLFLHPIKSRQWFLLARLVLNCGSKCFELERELPLTPVCFMKWFKCGAVVSIEEFCLL